MTRQQIGAIMDILHAAYPQFYKGMSDEENKNVLNLWATMFADDAPEVVANAVKALICNKKDFPPDIATVKAYIGKITQPDEMTEQEAWAFILKAVTNSAYDSAKQFKALPPVLQRLVGSPRQLWEWSQIDADQLNTVIASNFMRSYKVRAASEREVLALPADVKQFVGEIAGKMDINRLTEGETHE